MLPPQHSQVGNIAFSSYIWKWYSIIGQSAYALPSFIVFEEWFPMQGPWMNEMLFSAVHLVLVYCHHIRHFSLSNCFTSILWRSQFFWKWADAVLFEIPLEPSDLHYVTRNRPVISLWLFNLSMLILAEFAHTIMPNNGLEWKQVGGGWGSGIKFDLHVKANLPNFSLSKTVSEMKHS